jgi:hypothetical protein
MKLQQSLHKTIINLLWNSLMQAQIYPVLRATKIHNVFQLTIQKMNKNSTIKCNLCCVDKKYYFC